VDERAADPETSPKADRPAAPDARPGAKLFGRVLEEGTDIPVAGAAVTAFAFAAGRTLRTTTGKDGSFDLPDAVAAGQAFQLVVRHGGFGTVSMFCCTASDEPILVRLPRGGTLRGRVVATDGAPVSLCCISAVRTRGDDEPWDAHRDLFRQLVPSDQRIDAAVATRADGSFEFPRLAPGNYTLLLEPPDLSPFCYGRRRKDRVAVHVGAVTEVEIALPASAEFLVDVFDEATGEPLEAARFDVALDTAAGLMFVSSRGVPIGEGAYRLRAWFAKRSFNSHLLRVSRDGYAPRLLSIGGSTPEFPLQAALGRGARVEGHVRAAGKPIPGALLVVEGAWDNAIAAATTGEDGGYEIPGLDTGVDLLVRVYGSSIEPIAVAPVRLENGERRKLDFGASDTPAIEGRVVLGSQPAAHVAVSVSGASESDCETRGDGTYRIEGLPQGRHEIEFSFEDAWMTRTVNVARERVRLDVIASVPVSGVVVDQTGSPVTDVEDIEVVARRTNGTSDSAWTTFADGKGAFWLSVEPGDYEFDCPLSEEIYAVDRPRVSLTDGADAPTVTIRVARDAQQGRIEITVRDGSTGEPVPDGLYEWEAKGWSGSYSFGGALIVEEEMAIATHRFRIWSGTHAPSAVEVVLAPGQEIARQAVTLQPADAIRITSVKRGSPAAIAGLRVGDVLLSCNGSRTTSTAALNAALDEARPPLTIEFERGGEKRMATVATSTLGADVENILLGR
jgi:hypothetical protein